MCQLANKNCRLVYDVWQRCWDSEKGQVPTGGEGLMSRWYDACAGMWYEYCLYQTLLRSSLSESKIGLFLLDQ